MNLQQLMYRKISFSLCGKILFTMELRPWKKMVLLRFWQSRGRICWIFGVIDTGIGMDEEELKGLEQNGKGHSGVHSIGIKSIRGTSGIPVSEHYSFEIYSEKREEDNDFNIWFPTRRICHC